MADIKLMVNGIVVDVPPSTLNKVQTGLYTHNVVVTFVLTEKDLKRLFQKEVQRNDFLLSINMQPPTNNATINK